MRGVARRRKRRLAWWGAAVSLSLSGCGHGDGRAELKDRLGVELCRTARVTDLTTDAERNSYPGYSYHVSLQLDTACDSAFRQQLAELAPPECPVRTLRRHGCTIHDVARAAGRHATVLVVPGRSGAYDVRFFG